jgi:hypothetical protein
VSSSDAGASSASVGDAGPLSSTPCQGVADAAACDDRGVMYQCDHDGNVDQQQACGSRDLCRAGLPMHRCATCLPGTHICSGSELLECLATGFGFTQSAVCPSTALCDPAGGKCASPKCTPNSFVCRGNTLSHCNASGTKMVDTPCGSSACNQAQGRCDSCTVGSSKCDSSTTISTCRSDGQTYYSRSCDPARPRCFGGECVECATDSDCTGSLGPCKAWRCSQVMCQIVDAQQGTACTSSGISGTCGFAGACMPE